MRAVMFFIALVCLTGCSSPGSIESNNLFANPGPTVRPLTINQLNQNPRPRVSGEAGGSVVITAPAPGQISAGGPGSAEVDAWKGSRCRPGSPEASQYPCVTSMPNGDACQLGSCRPAEINGLPSLAEINRQ